MPKTKKITAWKYTSDVPDEKPKKRPAWTNAEGLHAEVSYQPYERKPTPMENWLGEVEEEEKEDGLQ